MVNELTLRSPNNSIDRVREWFRLCAEAGELPGGGVNGTCANGPFNVIRNDRIAPWAARRSGPPGPSTINGSIRLPPDNGTTPIGNGGAANA
jgi:hypothetical protein